MLFQLVELVVALAAPLFFLVYHLLKVALTAVMEQAIRVVLELVVVEETVVQAVLEMLVVIVLQKETPEVLAHPASPDVLQTLPMVVEAGVEAQGALEEVVAPILEVMVGLDHQMQ